MIAVLAMGAATPALAAPAAINSYVQTNLVTDGKVKAPVTDTNLKNPWGIAFFPSMSPFWISDNNAGVSTLYDGAGTPFPPGTPLVVKIPSPTSLTGGTPTGVVANIFAGGPGFNTPTTTSPSLFIFDTEDGTIVAWNQALADQTEAVIAKDNSDGGSATGAVYKGLAIGTNKDGDFIFATNFRAGTVEAYDNTFTLTALDGSFSDPKIPEGYAPFGIQNIGGSLYVTYAKQDKPKHDPVNGQGHGFVDVFDTEGNLLTRFAQHGQLNSPWGLVAAPSTFGRFANDILIGNFGDGRINAFKTKNGNFDGVLKDATRHEIVNGSLWALTFGGALNSSVDTLYITAGVKNEKHGVFATIVPSN
ncbi:MAG TPA: TIGR03118 family protein [Candidatus Binataceae bacterium]